MQNKPLISIKDVNQEFQVGEAIINPLKNINFNIKENSFNIIYGPSGSGKTTLLNILTGLQSPTTGTVTMDGKNIYELPKDELANFRATQLGFIYQTSYWIKSLNVMDNVALPLYFSGKTRRQASSEAHKALGLVKMEDYAKKMPALLSGGEQQRIAVARALVADPLFVVADEPTGSLDSKGGDMVMDLLKRCKTELKRTVILVTHNMEYLPLADQLLHIEDGQLQQMQDGDIKKTTDALLDDMVTRIKRLSKGQNDG